MDEEQIIERFDLAGNDPGTIKMVMSLVALLEERGQPFDDQAVKDYALGVNLINLAAHSRQRGNTIVQRLFTRAGSVRIKEAAAALGFDRADLVL